MGLFLSMSRKRLAADALDVYQGLRTKKETVSNNRDLPHLIAALVTAKYGVQIACRKTYVWSIHRLTAHD